MKIKYLTLSEIYENLLDEFSKYRSSVKIGGEGKYPTHATDWRFPVHLADNKFLKLFGVKVTDEIRQLNIVLKDVPTYYRKYLNT